MPWFKLAVLLGIAVVLACVPTAAVEAGPTLCVWKHLFGVECWGCGMTRALSCVCHGEFARAWDFNRLVVVVAPLLAGTWALTVRRQLRRIIRGGKVARRGGPHSASRSGATAS